MMCSDFLNRRSACLLGRELIHVSGEAKNTSGREGGCIGTSGRGAWGISLGVGCISTSMGSSLGQILTGSSLGQTSFEGGQLEGCMGDPELIGDHIMRGEGLVPKWGDNREEGFWYTARKLRGENALSMRRRYSPLDGYGGRDSGVSGISSSPPSSSPGVQEPASEEPVG